MEEPIGEIDKRTGEIALYYDSREKTEDPTVPPGYKRNPARVEARVYAKFVELYAVKSEYNKKLQALLRKEKEEIEKFKAFTITDATNFKRTQPERSDCYARTAEFEAHRVASFLNTILKPLHQQIVEMLHTKLQKKSMYVEDRVGPIPETDFGPFLRKLQDLGKKNFGTYFRELTDFSRAYLDTLTNYMPMARLIENPSLDVCSAIRRRLQWNALLLTGVSREEDFVSEYVLEYAPTQRFSPKQYATLCFNIQKMSEAVCYYVNNNWNVLRERYWLKPTAWSSPYQQVLFDAIPDFTGGVPPPVLGDAPPQTEGWIMNSKTLHLVPLKRSDFAYRRRHGLVSDDDILRLPPGWERPALALLEPPASKRARADP
jgi:hypothetical protein